MKLDKATALVKIIWEYEQGEKKTLILFLACR